MYIVIWENRHPYTKETTKAWEMFDSRDKAWDRVNSFNGVNFVKQVKLMEVTDVLG